MPLSEATINVLGALLYGLLCVCLVCSLIYLSYSTNPMLHNAADSAAHPLPAATAPLLPLHVAARLQVVLMGGGAEARAELQRAGGTVHLQARLAALQADADKAGRGDAPKARHKLLRETLLTLLQRSEEVSYGAGEEVGCGSEEDAERELLRWSLEEQARAGYVVVGVGRTSRPRTYSPVSALAVPGKTSPSSSSERFTAEEAAAVMTAALSAVLAGRAAPLPQAAAAAGEDTVVVTVMLVARGLRLLPERMWAPAGPQRGGGGSGRHLATPEELCEGLLSFGKLRVDDLLQLEVVWAPKAPGESLSWRQLQLSHQEFQTTL
ncbi:hypothetical protein GPECTOR_35g857 [Gonium pectorale]|uniref:Uncharacterized protein n=1 Tax=Gonium pectorale TaxID=33097 RepID=A0A150GC67_GONPE|nr:hypothetical protein GPECTOR_35g857 [Gonium pectorale]|eukprot:KXZ47419.1 hypothetical protein GPECTOR_35g857 [Gonium pectorale]